LNGEKLLKEWRLYASSPEPRCERCVDEQTSGSIENLVSVHWRQRLA
jgi:hypothetical protein